MLGDGADSNAKWIDNRDTLEGVLDVQAGWNSSGDRAWVELLLLHGFHDYQGAAFFLICRCYDDVEEAELVKRLFLLAKKEDRPFDVHALLCKAAEVGAEEPLKMLLSLGADVNHEGERGRPLNLYLQHFSENGSDGEHCVPMISAFIEVGVDVNAIDRGATALDIAFDDFDDISLVACLMRNGASRLARQDERTVLHLLSQKAKYITDERAMLHSLVQDVLAARSVDLNTLDAEGKTALDYANEVNDTDLIALLEQEA